MMTLTFSMTARFINKTFLQNIAKKLLHPYVIFYTFCIKSLTKDVSMHSLKMTSKAMTSFIDHLFCLDPFSVLHILPSKIHQLWDLGVMYFVTEKMQFLSNGKGPGNPREEAKKREGSVFFNFLTKNPSGCGVYLIYSWEIFGIYNKLWVNLTICKVSVVII